MNQGVVGGLATTTAIPPGVVWEYVGVVVPVGWLLCDGTAVSRSQYPDLFRVIGTQYGAGDGSTTFNLPPHQGKAGVGLDAGQTEFSPLGLTGGFKNKIASHTHDMQNHTHSRTAAGATGSTGNNNAETVNEYVNATWGRADQSANHSHGASTTGLGGGHADGLQGWAAGDNHVSCQTTNRNGELLYAGAVRGKNSVHAHGLTAHTHALEGHGHGAGTHTHADTFANPSPNVTGESSQVDSGQPASGNLQPYVVTNYIVKY